MNTITKVLSTLCSKHISYLAEKRNVLPPSQFSGRPGCNTTSSTQDKGQGKVVAALFLDVQGAFPNMVKDQLIHNMRMCRVPKCFTDIAELSHSN